MGDHYTFSDAILIIGEERFEVTVENGIVDMRALVDQVYDGEMHIDLETNTLDRLQKFVNGDTVMISYGMREIGSIPRRERDPTEIRRVQREPKRGKPWVNRGHHSKLMQGRRNK